MKIQVAGSELKNVGIEFLSLVKRGANRSPFKIVKAEQADERNGSMLGAVQKFFQMSDPDPTVVAVFVEKAAIEKSMPNLVAAGFKIDNFELQDDVVIFKQEGFDDCKAVIMLKSENNVGMAVANVAKHADLFNGSVSFDPSVKETGFYPGVNSALSALQKAIAADVSKTDAQTAAFTSYVGQITKALPEAVWKFETLQRGLGGVTVQTPNEQTVVLMDKVLKATGEKGGKAGGIGQQAKNQTESSDGDRTDDNNDSSTSELPGSDDDSPDTKAARKARMAKSEGDTMNAVVNKAGKTSTTSTTENGTTEPNNSTTTTSELYKGADGKEFILVKMADGKVVKYTPGKKIPEGATEMTMPWDQEGALGGTNNENGQGKGKAAASETSENEVHHTGAGGDKGNMDGTTAAGKMNKSELETMLANLLAPVTKSIGDLGTKIAEQGSELKKTSERLKAVEKTAETAVRKADNSAVHVQGNHDQALENLGGGRNRARRPMTRTTEMVRKEEYSEDLWAGSLGVLEHHVQGEDAA